MPDGITPERNAPEEPFMPVGLDKKFSIFVPGITQADPKSKGFITLIELSTEVVPPILLAIDLTTTFSLKNIKRVITPFHPEEGFTIDNEDLAPNTRYKKHARLGTMFHENEPPKRKYLDLFINDFNLNGKNPNLCYPYKSSRFRYRPQIKEILKNLRLQLFTPKGNFEGQVNKDALEGNDGPYGLQIYTFYPLDTGPLPTLKDKNPSSVYLSEGDYVSFPNDPEALKKLEARFVFAKEEPSNQNL